MKTAHDYAEQMAKEGIISEANIDAAEQYLLRYMDNFRIQLIKDIKGEKGDFDIMKEMSHNNQDIGAHLEMLNFQRDKRGGRITIGVAEPHFTDLINQAGTGIQTHLAALYVINKKQFNEIKDRKDA